MGSNSRSRFVVRSIQRLIRFWHRLVKSSSSSRSRFVVRSINIFDPDIAYLYADAIAEYDYLIVSRDETFIIEDVSGKAECYKKLIRNVFLSPNLPPVYWSSKNNRAVCEGQGFLKNPPIALDEARKLADSYKRVWEPLYKDATEIVNLLFYTKLFLSKTYAKIIYNDFKQLYGNNMSRTVIINRIIKFTEYLFGGLSSSEEEKSFNLPKELRLDQIIDENLCLIAMVQYGMGSFRIKNILDQLKNLRCYGKYRLIIALNRSLINRYKNEIHLFEEKLRKNGFTNIKLCILADNNDSNNKFICSRLIGSLEKENNEKEELDPNTLCPSGKYMILLLQDWNKEELLKWIKAIKDKKPYIVIAPETGYYYTSEGSTSKRLVESFYGYYSIRWGKTIIFRWD